MFKNSNNFSVLTRYKYKNALIRFAISLFRIVLLTSIGYIILYPLLYMMVTSLRSTASYSDPGITWILKDYEWANYVDAFNAVKFPESLRNTLLIEIVSAVLEIASCSIVAYGLSRFEFKAKKLFMVILILTIVIPTQMIIIPQMLNFSQLDIFGIFGGINKLTGLDLRVNILDTPFTFYIPSIFGVGLKSGIMIYIYIQFFKGLPKELEEAAWIDGAGPVKTFLTIALPSSGVVILTVTIFSIVWHWNDYYLAGMYMTNNRPLALALANLPSLLPTLGFGYQIVNNRAGSILMASCFMYILPVLIMYICLQNKFVKSIDRVGLTG